MKSSASRLSAFSLLAFFMILTHANAEMVLETNVSETAFNNAFNSNRVWYAQFQPGGANDTHPDNEFEIGGTSLRYYEGNTSVTDESNNPFEVNVSASGFLSATFNGVGTPGGSQLGITDPYNTVWVGLRLATGNGFPNSLEINTQQVDGSASLPDMFLEEQTSIWTAFKFYKDDDTANIGEISITGNINPDMFFGGAANEQWTYTVFATMDETLTNAPPIQVPPPSVTNATVSGDALNITWITDTNGSWVVQSLDDLTETNWMDETSVTMSTNGMIEFSTNLTESIQYFRLLHRP